MAAALLLVGLVGVFAPYTARPLGFVVAVRPIVEIVDHVVPGLVVIAASGLILATKRLSLVAALSAALAAFWMTATHVPLVAQAARGGVGWAAAWWHTGPGLVLLVLSALAGGAGVAAGARLSGPPACPHRCRELVPVPSCVHLRSRAPQRCR